VLDEAAQASESGNVPLVNGWPTAPYWHTLSQIANSDCPGQVVTSNNWLGKDGTDVAGNEVAAGPTSSDPTSSCDLSPKGYYPVSGTPAGAFIGGQQLPTGTVIAQSPAAGTPVTQEEVPTLTIRR
jgi:hypothetical protein